MCVGGGSPCAHTVHLLTTLQVIRKDHGVIYSAHFLQATSCTLPKTVLSCGHQVVIMYFHTVSCSWLHMTVNAQIIMLSFNLLTVLLVK